MEKNTKQSRFKTRWLCAKGLILMFLYVLFVPLGVNAQTALPYSQDFESAGHGWTLSNGTAVNKWVVGNAVSNGGTKSLYISNDNGTTNDYTNTSTTVVHAYKDFTIPANVSDINLEFDWRAEGESCCDYLRVWIVPTSFTPTVGTLITATSGGVDLLGNLNMDDVFKREQLIQDITNYNGTFRIVFEWRNDFSVGTSPAAAIDNIAVKAVTCNQPIGATITFPSTTSADVLVTPSPLSATGVTYEYEVRTSGAQGSGSTGLVVTGNSASANFTVNGLQQGEIYTIYIRTVCSSTDKSVYSSYDFIIVPISALPYTQTFEGASHDWELSNDNATNKWEVGDAVASSGTKSLYISDDDGVTNDYSHTTTVVHAYKDFEIPANISDISLGFDWRALGESCCDYLRVWIVPTSFIPTVGTQIPATSGGINLFGNLNMDDVFKREQLIQDISNYTGAFRVVFEWRNDASIGTSPAAAIDNIEITPVTCYRPIDVEMTDVKKDEATVTVVPDSKSATGISYEYEVRESGTPGSGTVGLVTSGTSSTDTFTVTGLQPETKYTIYVRTVCSSTDNSIWTDGVDFTTMCNYPDLIAAPSVTVCGPQEVDLTAVFDAGTVYWLDENGDLVHTGSNFKTPLLTEDTSYWAVAGDSLTFSNGAAGGSFDSVGPVDPSIGTGGFTNIQTYRLFFTVTNATTVYSVDIFPGTLGQSGTIDIYTASGTKVSSTPFTTTVAGSTGAPIAQTVVLDTPLTPGDYYMIQDTSVNIFRNTAGASFPYSNSDISITGHSFTGNPQYYYYFYNWQIGGGGCASELVEVQVTVEPKPEFELSSYKVTSCEGGDDSELVTITTNLGGYDTFVWTPSTGVSGDEVNGWIFNTSEEQEYTLTASQSDGICEQIKKVLVFSGTKPRPNPNLATEYDVCKDEITELNLLEELPSNVTIGVGTTTTSATSEMSAFVQTAAYSKQQYIYRASELIAQGVDGAGYITELAFETINSGASFDNDNYTIKMMLSPDTAFPDDNFYTGKFSTVYTAETHTHTFQGTQSIVFDNPFYWDGQSNIVVQITQEGMEGNNNAQTYYTDVSADVGLYATSETDADPTIGTVSTNRLNLEFTFEQAKVTWSPVTNLFVDAAATIPYTAGLDAPTVYTISSQAGSEAFTATLTGLNGCATTETYTINIGDVGVPVVQDQTFCATIPVTDVIVTGVQDETLNFYDSATATTPITTIPKTGTYYVEAQKGDCVSVRVPFNITLVNLALPTVDLTQVVCDSGTIADLSATGISGSQVKWYASATSTTALPATQALVDNTTYYVAQASNGCESGRVAVLVEINPIPSALSTQTISVCGTMNYGNVDLNQVSGSELVWYASATSQQPIDNNSAVISGTYYVSQKVNGCESPRTQIIVSSAQGSVPVPTATTTQNFCGSGTVADLTAQILPNATVIWYGSSTSTAPLQSSTALSNGTYYVAQQVDNCISNRVAVAVRVINNSAPVVAPFNLCEGSTVADLDVPAPTGVSYRWYLNGTTTTELLPTDVLQSGTYFVEKVQNGCESARTQVQVTINSRPNSPTGDTVQEFENHAEISNIIMDQANVVWYLTYDDAMNGINPLPGNMPLVDGNTYYAVIIGVSGCPSYPTAVTINIVLGLNDFDLNKLNYYPNPVSDVLTISYKEVITQVEVFDLNGRLIMDKGFDSETVQLDFANLSSGTYMLNIKSKEHSQFVKIVKK